MIDLDFAVEIKHKKGLFLDIVIAEIPSPSDWLIVSQKVTCGSGKL